MPASAFLLAFAAAWIHGVSNVFVGRRQEPEAAFAFMLVVGVIAFAPIAVLTWDVDAAAIPYIAASAALELGYFAFLAAGYRMSEVSLVYPVARGSGADPRARRCRPLPPPRDDRRPGRRRDRRRTRDRARARRRSDGATRRRQRLPARARSRHVHRGLHARRQAGPPARGADPVHRARADRAGRCSTRSRSGGSAARWRSGARRPGASGSSASILFGTYILVLFALRLAPAASVSAVRETSVVIASGLAAVMAHEHVTPDALRGRRARRGGHRARRPHVLEARARRQRRTRLRAMKSTFAGRSARRRIR